MVTKKKQRYNEGGVASNTNYPFGQGQVSATQAPTTTGLGNNSPLVQVNTPGAEVAETPEANLSLGMKKGGRVKANVKKMAFGGLGGLSKPVMGKPVAPRPVAPRPVAPKPVMGNRIVSGIKPLPPGSIGFPGGPNGKTMYSDRGSIGPEQLQTGPSSFYGAMMRGPAAPNQPVMGNNIDIPAFKNMTPATFQSGMKKGGAVKTQANKMASGGVTSSASKRGDGIAQRGKTKGRMR